MVSLTLLLSTGALVVYLWTVRRLRYQRMNYHLTRYRHYLVDAEALGQMNLKDAFDIQLALAELEFPTTFSVSIFFALFKTYGIPSISSLLARTGELSGKATASKRAADTGVLLTEIVLNEPGTERNLDAIARMNWLHSLYRRNGRIKDDDMLYTLSLFALEAIRWTKDLEWRQLTNLERCAMGVYWKNLGDAMEIPFDRLPSSSKGWTNAVEWMDELEAWSEQYEAEHCIPDPTNRYVGDATINIGLTNVPPFLRPIGTQFAAALLSPRLRRSMLFDEPPTWVKLTLTCAISVRRFTIQHMLPPRPASSRMKWFSDQADAKTGNYHFEQYIGHPWYINPSWARRWLRLNSWLLWLTGGNLPSAEHEEYRPGGYRLENLGPVRYEGKGKEEMEAAKQAIAKMQKCPFHVRKE